jgi:hypothetical protein
MRRRKLRALATLLLSLAAPVAFARAQASSSGEREGRSVIGRVLDRNREAVQGAEVSLLDGDSARLTVRSRTDGAFELRDLVTGTHEVLVRRLGFRARRFSVTILRDGPPVRLDAMLTAMPLELEMVRIEATIEDSKGKLREFYEHQARAQFGYFFGPDEIARKRLRVASEIVRAVPGARLLPARFGHRIQFRGCKPLVWIDGQRIADAELDEVMDADDIAAIEIYPSLAGLPPQYVSFESRCGVIAVWTRVS